MNQQQMEEYLGFPTTRSCRLIDFDEFELVRFNVFAQPGDPPPFELQVRGVKPVPDIEIELAPRVHLQQPRFWGIEVVGRPVEEASGDDDYDVSLDLRKITLANFELAIPEENFEGVEGIRLLGATHSENRAFQED